uniref:Lectin n=1 Tax=Styphnolobium japonicum TaxID=3897 RepID=P93537_STYJP|nr:lectin precursor [Styphnolobium japonicum]
MAISNTNFLQTKKPLFLPILAFITIFLMLLNRVNSSDSLSFTYENFQPNPEDLILQRDASITSNETLLLTRTSNGKPQKGSVGRALYYAPVRLWDKSTGRLASFETSFSFVITSPTTDPGDGIAFFIAPPDTTPGYTGGLLGLFNSSTVQSNSSDHGVAFHNSLPQIVAVEFDTYINGGRDPNYRHVGIDVNSIKSVSTTKWTWRNGVEATANISYNPVSQRLTAVSSYPNSEPITVHYDIDLKTVLPEWVRVGFSASTGENVEINSILSWSFSSSLQSLTAEKEDMYIARYV